MIKDFRFNWRIEVRQICKILKDNGVNVENIVLSQNTSEGKRGYILLKDLKIEGIDIEQIIKSYGLIGEFPLGYYITRYRQAYTGVNGNVTDEERSELETLGIVTKGNKQTEAPTFKGRKITQFHLTFINEIIDKILEKQISTSEALKLLNSACIDNGEETIKTTAALRKCILNILKDNPNKLKRYYEIYKTERGKVKIHFYHEEEEKFKRKIIEQYLPLLIKGEITFKAMEQELFSSRQTINRIIEDYYFEQNDFEVLKKYKAAKKEHVGTSSDIREDSKRKRNEELDYKIISNSEFLLLSPEEQRKQLFIQIRLFQLEQEKRTMLRKEKSSKVGVSSKEAIESRINAIMAYFKSKNTDDKIYFSDEDIRYMIFRYMTLLNRSKETLDEKIKNIMIYGNINEENTYGMIKSFPAILGYETSRIRQQLTLLREENLIDDIIANPRTLMTSVELMYALIQFAKERYHTEDLSGIKHHNIFIINTKLKRVYKTSFEELKLRYPYSLRQRNSTNYQNRDDDDSR